MNSKNNIQASKNNQDVILLHQLASQLKPNPSAENPLTIREMTCLILLAMGKNPDQCGDHLGISARSVTTYEERIRKKLGARTRTQALYLAYVRGYVQLI